MSTNIRHLVDNVHLLSRLVIDVLEKENIKKLLPMSLTRNQLNILRILHNSGSKSVKELANIIDVSNAAVSKNVEKMVKRNLVKRQATTSDRRQAEVSILKAGVEYLNQHDESWQDRQYKILSEFSTVEMDQFNHLVDKYIKGCLKEDRSVDLICLQCGGLYDEGCTICLHRGYCSLQRSEVD